MATFITSFLFVFLAEMGDKTQLLAMAFATRYPPHKVLVAVFLATFLNHSLAVAVGKFLTTLIPIDVLSFIAALSFILFALWTIKGDQLDGEATKASRFGPIVTVGIAFFLTEMGDKTQLATISLAIGYQNAIPVLLGTTLGMVTSDAIGILAGVVLRKHIPEEMIKWVSASVFALFGFTSIYLLMDGHFSLQIIAGTLLGILLVTLVAAFRLTRPHASGVHK